MFIALLIVMAALPFGILGHELFHFGFSKITGQDPVAICLDFREDTIASVVVTNMDKNTVLIDEVFAYMITIIITFWLSMKIFNKHNELYWRKQK